MYQVIEAIPFDAQAIQNLPDWKLGPGLLVTLDVRAGSPEESQVVDSFVESYSPVRVHRPDGTFIDCEATAVGFTGENVSLFFPKLSRHDIPKSSCIQLMPPFCPTPPPNNPILPPKTLQKP
jgi:hypothetical protein